MAHTRTPDFARLDDIDVYIKSTPMSAKEEKQFSEVLKAYRAKHTVQEPLRKVLKTPKRRKATNR